MNRVKQLRGESDPRLLGDQNNTINMTEVADDSQRSTNSDSVYMEETEDLLDVDAPGEDFSHYSTPTNNRHYRVHVETTPRRQAKLMNRLESPPEDFYKTPLSPKPIETENLFKQDTARMERFVNFHKAQIREIQDCLEKEISILQSFHHTLENIESKGDDDEEINDEAIKDSYENYLNELEDIVERSVELKSALSDKIKEERDNFIAKK